MAKMKLIKWRVAEIPDYILRHKGKVRRNMRVGFILLTPEKRILLKQQDDTIFGYASTGLDPSEFPRECASAASWNHIIGPKIEWTEYEFKERHGRTYIAKQYQGILDGLNTVEINLTQNKITNDEFQTPLWLEGSSIVRDTQYYEPLYYVKHYETIREELDLPSRTLPELVPN